MIRKQIFVVSFRQFVFSHCCCENNVDILYIWYMRLWYNVFTQTLLLCICYKHNLDWKLLLTCRALNDPRVRIQKLSVTMQERTTRYFVLRGSSSVMAVLILFCINNNLPLGSFYIFFKFIIRYIIFVAKSLILNRHTLPTGEEFKKT